VGWSAWSPCYSPAAVKQQDPICRCN
jgi:hypothetical protein